MNGTKHSNGAYDLNGETNMAQPEFTAEASLYVSTGHYQVQHWLGDLRLSYAAMPQQASACPTGGINCCYPCKEGQLSTFCYYCEPPPAGLLCSDFCLWRSFPCWYIQPEPSN